MTKSPPTNIGASVRARLNDLARKRGEDFQLVLTRYANERLLYRLYRSKHADHFVLKGAALFIIWTGTHHRVTRDIDLLGTGDLGEARLREIVGDVLTQSVEDDGVVFDLGSVNVGPIRKGQAYGGLRVELIARITTAQVRLQVDVGFGDAITPDATEAEFPTLLDFAAPRIRAYPRETVVAEKLDALVQLGLTNSRMKDFYDLVVLARRFQFDGGLLVRAITATFDRRGTPLPTGTPIALTAQFVKDVGKNTQWTAFLRKADVADGDTLSNTMAAVSAFVERPLLAAATQTPFAEHWPAGGPWT